MNDSKNLFIKEFNLILSDKNKEIESLQEKIIEKNKIIQLYGNNISESEFWPQQSTKTMNGLKLESNRSKSMVSAINQDFDQI